MTDGSLTRARRRTQIVGAAAAPPIVIKKHAKVAAVVCARIIILSLARSRPKEKLYRDEREEEWTSGDVEREREDEVRMTALWRSSISIGSYTRMAVCMYMYIYTYIHRCVRAAQEGMRLKRSIGWKIDELPLSHRKLVNFSFSGACMYAPRKLLRVCVLWNIEWPGSWHGHFSSLLWETYFNIFCLLNAQICVSLVMNYLKFNVRFKFN